MIRLKPALRRMATSLVISAPSLMVIGCSTWTDTEKHPLHEVVVNGTTGEQLTRKQLLDDIASSEVVYLGEKHDNSHHHRGQQWIIETVIGAGRHPAIGLEVVAAAETSILMEYAAPKSHKIADDAAEQRLRAALGWTDSDNLSWQRYGPLLKLAREHQLPVFGIDLPLSLRRRISSVGIDGLIGAEARAVPALARPDPEYRTLMMERLKAAHCGHGSDAYLSRLFDNWQARNQMMAETIASMTDDNSASPVIVIVGAGHTVNNKGVVAQLEKLKPQLKQLNIAFRELTSQSKDSKDHVTPHANHDVVWLTEQHGVSLEQACREFIQALKSHSKKRP